MRRCPFSPTCGHGGSGKPSARIVSVVRWSVPVPAEEVKLHLLVIGSHIGIERAPVPIGHTFDIRGLACFQCIYLFISQVHPFQLFRDDDFLPLRLPLLHLAVQSPEVVVETAFADIVLEACIVMLLMSLRPHIFYQYRPAKAQIEPLVFSQSNPVNF